MFVSHAAFILSSNGPLSRVATTGLHSYPRKEEWESVYFAHSVVGQHYISLSNDHEKLHIEKVESASVHTTHSFESAGILGVYELSHGDGMESM